MKAKEHMWPGKQKGDEKGSGTWGKENSNDKILQLSKENRKT